MFKYIKDWLGNWDYLGKSTELFAYLLFFAAVVAISLLVWAAVRFVFTKIMAKIINRTRFSWDDILYKNKLFHRVSNIILPVTANLFLDSSLEYNYLFVKLITLACVVIIMMLIDSVINSADEIYQRFEVSKTRPIKSLLQVFKVVLFILSGVVGVAVLLGESPLVLIGGIGAMTAVTSFIFKDAILGFVAGIQLTGNDMLRIGDWIEMPKCSADGTVTDLTMTTVKVENFDKTITFIPAYTMVSEAFINWRGMENSGGRRIKRSIYIDASGVSLCSDKTIEKFKRIELLREYISGKQKEIEAFNSKNNFDLSEPVNGRRITNIGTFRAYIYEYLKRHPGIRKDMIIMVRQLDPDDRGLPLEIYAFTNTVVWSEYENIQSDIFDHLYAAVSEFGLRIYQKPSGSDIRQIGCSMGAE